MSQFLQVKVEDIHVLLPALQVHEVMSLEGLVTQSDAHVAWRDRILALMDLGQVLGRPQNHGRHYGVVYSTADEGTEPVMLQVSEVLGLRTPQAQDWRPLPSIQSKAQALLDAVWVEPPDEKHSFRLRHPVNLSQKQLT